MNHQRFYKAIIAASFLLFLLAAINACKKGEKFASSDGHGSTIVKLKDGEKSINVFARDIAPTVEEFALIDIRRDAKDNASLKQPLTVSLSVDESVIEAYNDENNTSYELMPASAYSFAEDLANITFQPGELAKVIKITINKDQMDLSKQYALGLTITSVGAGGTISKSLPSALYSIGLKNKYDGTYTLYGAFYHPTESPGYDAYSVDVELHTSGPNSVKIFWPGNGYYHPALFSGTLDAFGAQEPEYTIDPVTNKVTVQNAFPGAVTFYTMGPGFDSHYDPATKTIHARFGYNYAQGPVFDPGANREWTDELVYKGPR
jgi:hypothetical protein